MSAMASAYLIILPRTIIGFLTAGTTYSTNIILFAYNTLKQEKQKIIFVFFKKNETGVNTKKDKKIG